MYGKLRSLFERAGNHITSRIRDSLAGIGYEAVAGIGCEQLAGFAGVTVAGFTA